MKLLIVALLSLFLAALVTAQPTTAPVAATDDSSSIRALPTPTAVIAVDGMVDDYMASTLKARFAEARRAGAQVIILKLNTYGGLVTAGVDISRMIKQTRDIHTICFINEKAISAGSMIAMACDEIIMEPNSLLGDCGVISMGGEMDDVTRAKAESLVLEEFADSAEHNGYDPLLVRTFIVVPATAYYIENTATGQHRFVDEPTYKRLVTDAAGSSPVDADTSATNDNHLLSGDVSTTQPSAWRDVPEVRAPLDGPDSLLTVRATLAQRIGLAKGIYPNVQALAADRDYNIVAEYTPSPGDRLVALLGGYVARGILMMIFMISVYAAIHSPGSGLPEVACLASLAVLLGIPALTGLATWWEIMLVLIGILLLAVELFVIPGFGLTGFTGIIMIFTGLAMTFVPPIKLPDTPIGYGVDWSWLGYGITTIVASMAASLLLGWWLGRYLPTLPYFNRLMLQAGGETATVGISSDGQNPVWPTAGTRGKVMTDLRPGGQAEFYDPALGSTRNVDVVSQSGFVNRGDSVEVQQVRGNHVIVKRVT